MLIGGELVHAASGGSLDAINPATRTVIAKFPSAESEDVDAAVEAAAAASREWGRLPVSDRAQYVRKLAAAIEINGDEFALLDTLDNGSPIRVMRGDYRLAVEQLRYFADMAPMLRGETIPTSESNSIDFTTRSPFGVVARIVPFNHPLMFAAAKLAAPLVAGNTVVLKPSQHTSLSALRLGELCADVLPPGVVNVITGRGSTIGDALVSHPQVRRIAFTGSGPVGRRIQEVAANRDIKFVTLELGGKNPIIVYPDADYAAAVQGVIRGMNFTWQGQSCGSTSRLYVHRSIYDRFVTDLVEAMNELAVGDPLDEATDVGPVVSADQYHSVIGFIERAIEHPATSLLTGGLPEPGLGGDGFFIRPTLFASEHDDNELSREEVFGPVLVVTAFDTEAEVIARANALPLGLTASVWTSDLGRAMRATRDIEAGYVWVNWSSSHIPGTPFGGVKNSGIGREEGIDELHSYSQLRNVYIRFDDHGAGGS